MSRPFLLLHTHLIAFVRVGADDANYVSDVTGFDAEGKWRYIDKAGAYVWQH